MKGKLQTTLSDNERFDDPLAEVEFSESRSSASRRISRLAGDEDH
jgi:hypothetical protein